MESQIINTLLIFQTQIGLTSLERRQRSPDGVLGVLGELEMFGQTSGRLQLGGEGGHVHHVFAGRGQDAPPRLALPE